MIELGQGLRSYYQIKANIKDPESLKAVETMRQILIEQTKKYYALLDLAEKQERYYQKILQDAGSCLEQIDKTLNLVSINRRSNGST